MYKRSDIVLALDIHSMKWRPALLHEAQPYYVRGRKISDGWYVYWRDLPAPDPSDPYNMPSTGGWISEANIRPK